MGLAPSSDWFNAFTQELVMNLDGVEKSMDDFLAKAPTLEKLEETLRKFFDNCKDLGVKISTKKFKASTKVRFEGTIINSEGEKTYLEADPGKLQRILDFLRPNNKDKLLSFLGLIKTLHKCSGGLSLIMKKMRELTKSNTTWGWEEEHTEEFEKAKEILKEKNVKL